MHTCAETVCVRPPIGVDVNGRSTVNAVNGFEYSKPAADGLSPPLVVFGR
jgi:hypothetical protein